MKKIWQQCWYEFSVWFSIQWKYAWDVLKNSVIGLVLALFEWAKTIIGGLFAGLWKLVIKPVGKWCREKIIQWIEKI